ncbi:MAG: deiodinase-like protein [Terriglobales bacterium]
MNLAAHFQACEHEVASERRLADAEQYQVVLASPKDEEERALVAGSCIRKLGIQIPAVIDEFGNSTEKAYTGRTDRLYLIDARGDVAYKAKPGPFGFRADELGAALGRLIPSNAADLRNKFRPQ